MMFDFKTAILPDRQREDKLTLPDGVLDIVLDTDACNEIDDQFALTYALLSKERIRLRAVTAAPFWHERVSSPSEGMLQSYNEILKIYDLMNEASNAKVFKGAAHFMQTSDKPVESEGIEKIIKLALDQQESLLYVVGIGAPTNIASAIVKCPEILEKIVVIWLGGHPYDQPWAGEFNLQQDIIASKILFDSTVPLIHIPCKTVAQNLVCVKQELSENIRGLSRIGDYLFDIFVEYLKLKKYQEKVIWDLANIAFIINQNWVPTKIVSSPHLNADMTWTINQTRHLIAVATSVNRYPILKDFYAKMKNFTN